MHYDTLAYLISLKVESLPQTLQQEPGGPASELNHAILCIPA